MGQIPLKKLQESRYCLPVGPDDARRYCLMLCESFAMDCEANEGGFEREECVDYEKGGA